MVVGVNFLFEELTDSVQDNVARDKLISIVNTVEDKIFQAIDIGQQTGNDVIVQMKIDLPISIGSVYHYEILLSNTTFSDWSLVGHVIDSTTTIEFSTNFRINGEILIMGGSFMSTSSNHWIIFRSGVHSPFTKDFCQLIDE